MKLRRLLITGAAGHVGRIARARLGHLAETLRLSDVAEMAPAGAGEEVMRCDLADREATFRLLSGCDGVVHLGGVPVEAAFDDILEANLLGLYNLYEAARKAGTKRILFASSNHVIGFHERETRLDATAPLRPDSLYGVSKCFGEAVARLYWDKFGVESALVRIGSVLDAPKDHRMLATWLSPADFARLAEAVFRAPRLGCAIVYGASANDESWWDNSAVGFLGWRPLDNSERFRAMLDAAGPPPPPDDAYNRWQGGGFATAGHFED